MSGGFVMIPTWLLEKQPSATALLAYANLARRGTFYPGTGTYQECRPSMGTLAADMHVGVHTARRGVQELESLGAVTGSVRHGDNGCQLPTVYQVVFADVAEPTPPPKSVRGAPPKSVRGPLTDLGDNLEPNTKNPKTKKKPEVQKPSPNLADASSGAALALVPDFVDEKTRAVADTAQTILAGWIDYCGERQVSLTGRIKGQYAARIKACLVDGIDPNLIKRALASMLDDNVAHQPSWLDNRIIQTQTGAERPRVKSSALVERDGLAVTAKNAAAMDVVARFQAMESLSVLAIEGVR